MFERNGQRSNGTHHAMGRTLLQNLKMVFGHGQIPLHQDVGVRVD
jgi:hypothetical protein